MRILICTTAPPSQASTSAQRPKDDGAVDRFEFIAVDAGTLAEIFGRRGAQAILLAYARAYRVQVALVTPGVGTGTDLRQRLQDLQIELVDLSHNDPESPETAWLAAITAHLTAHGISPDQTISPAVPDAAEAPLLAMAAMAQAHTHEQKGLSDLAARFYQEVLRYDPADAQAHAGLARLAVDGDVARAHWRQAAALTSITQTVEIGRQFGLPGLSEAGANLAQATANGWLARIMADQAYDDVPAATRLLSHYDRDLSLQAAQFLHAKGRPALAIQALAAELDNWPDNVAALRLRGDLAFDQGRFAAAQADFDLADRLEG